jgi:hypothetical protein
MSLLGTVAHPAGSLTADAVTIATVIAVMTGWYGAKWLRAERDEETARAALARTVTVMWTARRAAVVVAVLGVLAVSAWFRGTGRSGQP